MSLTDIRIYVKSIYYHQIIFVIIAYNMNYNIVKYIQNDYIKEK